MSTIKRMLLHSAIGFLAFLILWHAFFIIVMDRGDVMQIVILYRTMSISSWLSYLPMLLGVVSVGCLNGLLKNPLAPLIGGMVLPPFAVIGVWLSHMDSVRDSDIWLMPLSATIASAIPPLLYWAYKHFFIGKSLRKRRKNDKH